MDSTGFRDLTATNKISIYKMACIILRVENSDTYDDNCTSYYRQGFTPLMYATLVGGYDVTAAILKEVQYIPN